MDFAVHPLFDLILTDHQSMTCELLGLAPHREEPLGLRPHFLMVTFFDFSHGNPGVSKLSGLIGWPVFPPSHGSLSPCMD
jgi:hypothetical protein